ncbi:MAG TPA: hypothetical protein VN026_01650 [Bacteroidia bacterium]|jgi:hypothetical protein|nr:hypothetical protein [Bacteroidia bacterium]
MEQTNNDLLNLETYKKVINTKSKFKGLPFVYETDDSKIFQVGYCDKRGGVRKPKEIILKEHKGSKYYRINGKRYSDFRLQTLSVRSRRTIDLKDIYTK